MIIKLNDLMDIFDFEVRKNTKNKRKIYQFEKYKMINILNIYQELSNDIIRPIKYNIFLVKYPKYRVVMSLNISDKIINHYVARYILINKLDKFLDDRNIATRTNLGRDYGINNVKEYLEHFKKYDKFYILKMDISKYFYSIDHEVLKEMLKNDLDTTEYKIMCNIIDSTNYDYINDTIDKLKYKELNGTSTRIKEVNYLYKHDRMKLETAFSSINTYSYGFKYGSRLRIRRIINDKFFD